MLHNKTSSKPKVDTRTPEQTHLVEVFLRQICGDCKALRPMMFNSLLILATKSNWALSTILDMEYIQIFEQYCKWTKPCAIPISLPQLLSILVSRMALEALSIRSESDPETRPFLQTLEVPSVSTKRSSELVPFAGRLCSALAEHDSQLKSLFTESSPSDGTISALSSTLPSESPLLNGNTVFILLYEGLSLLNSIFDRIDNTFQDILFKYDFVSLLKSTIIARLDLLEQQKTQSKCPPSERTDILIKILDGSWKCASSCLGSFHKSLRRAVESTFYDIQELCSLLVRTCRLSSHMLSSPLRMLLNLTSNLPHLIPRILKENLVERLINFSQPMTVPTTNGELHYYFIDLVVNLIWDPRNITEDNEEQKRIRILQFERLLKPAKQYLQFILQREEFIPKAVSRNKDLAIRITELVEQTLVLERELFEYGEIVESGREEWEVGWLVGEAEEKFLSSRLYSIREEDEKLKKDGKERWKRRVERRREAGHEDAMEGWLMRKDNRTRSDIVDRIESIGNENGMNMTISGG
ncbi:hypothetical protein BLNAU_17373 [Blattamonas nauphoetae]|uniref:Uncharacterized protein n=1 Tax=Blattamonas nauphoetae TaxID=2049346 RepID=A0ABQ9X8Y2_9EUKA|nr:hypothetical protein BLNAU_17373 [Blattamonas nauphoetae]